MSSHDLSHQPGQKRPAINPKTKGPGEKPGSSNLAPAGLIRLQKLAGNRAVQRLLQRSPLNENTAPFELDEETASHIDQARSGGQPLDTAARTSLEPELGYDLSSVKVHNSPDDSRLSQSVGAKAFTLGQDIFFKEGAYNPDSADGKQLLAHELTHVVQQNNGSIGASPKMSVNAPNDIYEQEADQVAKQVAAQANTSSSGSAAQAQIQRKEEEY